MLAAVPQSRLLVLCHEGQRREITLARANRLGIEANRVEFVAYGPRQRYLQHFARIDISLDTLPYNGHTTSVWGNCAETADEYVEIATKLVANPPKLNDLRRTLRQRMQQSPLMDAAAFARGIETAYRTMWGAVVRER